MNETSIVSKLTTALRRDLKTFVILKHADRFTHGVPDISVTGCGLTSWWEVKLANPTFDSPGIQELTMLRLAKNGFARYIVFRDDPKSTRIVAPSELGHWTEIPVVLGFDFEWITQYIKEHHSTHGHRNRP